MAELVERRRVADFKTDADAVISAVAALQAKKARWFQLHLFEHEIAVEGWRREPEGFGRFTAWARRPVKPGSMVAAD